MKFLSAWRFLTVVPLPGGRRPASPDDIGGSLVYFPVIGLLLGLALALLGWLLGFFLPRAVIAVLLMISLTLLTGGMHLDGLADTCDGFGGSNPEERLRIMRDSHTGSFGVIGIVCILLLQVVTLILLPGMRFYWTLIAAPVVGRWAMVYAIYAFPYARPSGLGTVFKERSGIAGFIVATVITLLVTFLFLRFIGLIAFAVTAGIVTGVAFFFKRRLGGLTGDTYGSVNEITQSAILLLVIALGGWAG
jgi:adenosylcobinamide-GDP ribazoletransferase